MAANSAQAIPNMCMCVPKKTYRIRTSPPLVRARVDHPQLREGVVGGGGLRAPDAVVVAQVARLGPVVAVRAEVADGKVIVGYRAEEALHAVGSGKLSVSLFGALNGWAVGR